MKLPALAALTLAAILLSGCTATVAKAPSSSPASTIPPLAATTPSPTLSPALSGPVGTTYQVTDSSGNEMTVTLTKVIDPAQGADSFTTPNNGDRFVGTVFSLTGVSGNFSDDANNDASLIGSNGQTYTADFNSISGYTNFNDGEFNVSTGQTSVGAVTFQVPVGVTVSTVEWNANSGFGGTPAEWVVTP